MGVLYAIIPLDAELGSWLTEQGYENVPSTRGRWPTPRELRHAVGNLPAVQAEWHGNLPPEADLSTPDGRRTTLRVTDYINEDTACHPYFSKGSDELVTDCVLELAARTGPLVIYPDTGTGIQLVFDGKVVRDPLESP